MLRKWVRVRCPMTHFPNTDVVFANYRGLELELELEFKLNRVTVHFAGPN